MTDTLANIAVNGDRLWQSLMEMARIGPGVAGGNNRQALTDADGEARHLFRHWCEDAGMTVRVDKMGTMFARRDGDDPDAPPVMVGSHLDTQPTGGKFDGVLGVLAGLEIIRSINESGIKTRHPIEVVNWTNEEGCRFAPPMMASGVYAGVYDLDWAYTRQDREGVSFGDELNRIGWVGEETPGDHLPKAYFELHIEQGPILEAADIPIGIVTHGQGSIWSRITLKGREAHTGSTPMGHRANAGLGMARVTSLVDEIAWSHAPHAVGTVGSCEIFPNSINIIPGLAVFTVDFRSPDAGILNAMQEELEAKATGIAKDIGLEITFEQLSNVAPVTFDTDCVSCLRDAARSLNYDYKEIVSGAGHDAFWVNKVAPSAMIMCPCVDGLSHNEAEDISPYWARSSTDVLYRAVLEMAEIIDN